jgi:hypothetical protein
VPSRDHVAFVALAWIHLQYSQKKRESRCLPNTFTNISKYRYDSYMKRLDIDK